MAFLWALISTGLIIFGTFIVWPFLLQRWIRPRKLAALLLKQGISGPRPGLFVGNSLQIQKMRATGQAEVMDTLDHNIVPHCSPEVSYWSKLYGKQYVYWWTYEPRIMASDPELVREVLSKKFRNFEKSYLIQLFGLDLLGYGVATVNSDEWSYQRRMLSPAFHVEQMKGKLSTISTCTSKMVEALQMLVRNGECEVDIDPFLKALTVEIISHTAFGSSYEKGSQVFTAQEEIGARVRKARVNVWLPYYRLHPTKLNRELWKIQKDRDAILRKIINERIDMVKHGRTESYGTDLLGLMLQECGNDKKFNYQILIDECKTFYVAGQDTTCSMMIWTLYLLSAYPHWQDEARDEVNQICKNGIVDADNVGKLKTLNMIFNESLRLYPPIPEIHRCNIEDVQVKSLFVPKGVGFTIPIMAIHHDPDLWGADVNEFKPERFKDGIANAAKHPAAFVPFSNGPRVCLGQVMAVMEAKVVVARILHHFRFRLSPNYRHLPSLKITVSPRDGMQLILEAIN